MAMVSQHASTRLAVPTVKTLRPAQSQVAPSCRRSELIPRSLQCAGGRYAAEISRGRLKKSFSCTGERRIQRRRVVSSGVGAGLVAICASMADTSAAAAEAAPRTADLEMLPFREGGYNFWHWRGHRVHYVVQGKGPPILLIHGFGASAFHWRYNIPDLAKSYTVYAMDLLGFGWSDKALIDYTASLWRDQVNDFVQDVVCRPTVLVGNSVGGFTALLAAANRPDLTSGLVLVNASGQFETAGGVKKRVVGEETALWRQIINPAKTFARKWAIWFAFWQAKQPARILSVLKNVYVDQTNVDDYLVNSIVQPAKDPNAFEVYYRLMTQVLFKSSEVTLDSLLAQLSVPLLLLWGELDPWMGPTKADRIKQLYPSATLVLLKAGHCPHDESPANVNRELRKWVSSIAQT